VNLEKTIKEEYSDIDYNVKKELQVDDTIQKDILKQYNIWLREANDIHDSQQTEESTFLLIYVYNKARDLLKKNVQSYTAEDITKFSTSVKKPKNYRPEFWAKYQSGLFLSALINVHAERTLQEELTKNSLHIEFQQENNSYLLITPEFEESPNLIGFQNERAHILVQGDVGKCCGSRMSGGSITIQGIAGSYLGEYMNGGKITVHSARDYAGFHMKDGELHIQEREKQKSEFPFCIGLEKTGGDIYFQGTKLRFFEDEYE